MWAVTSQPHSLLSIVTIKTAEFLISVFCTELIIKAIVTRL
jgi:hypothetical protein